MPAIPLAWKDYFDARYPDFPIPRLIVDVLFEPSRPDTPAAYTYFEAALIDTAAPYVVIPHHVHGDRHVKLYQDLGHRPYRLLSEHGPAIPQRFAEVGLQFLAKLPDGKLAYLPDHFVRVKAYLLDAVTRPKKRVLIGLEALRDNFIGHLEKETAYLQERPPA
jgi:hypothetical protein